MGNVFGSCEDKDTFVTIEEGLFNQFGNEIIRFTSADGSQQVDICKNPLKGATLNGVPVSIENGILVLEDMFGSGEVSADGETYTVTFPGQAPVDICLVPLKSVTGDGVDNSDPQNPVISGSSAASLNGETTTTHPDGTTHVSCDTPVKSVTGDIVDDSDPQNVVINETPETVTNLVQDVASGDITYTNEDGVAQVAVTKHSTTVPAVPGFHDITTDDGVTTRVCLTPVKTVNNVAPDINGNVNVADLFGNTVDNGDGTFTTTNADGTTVTWSGDTFATQANNGDGTVTFTMADGSTVTLCLNPVKSVVQNADGLGATVTYADGTVGNLVYPISTAVSVDGETTTTHPDGTVHVSCDAPVKSVSGNIVDDSDPQNVVINESVHVPSSLVDNGDNSFTHSDGQGNDVIIGTGDVTDNGNGTATVTDKEGTACVVPSTLPAKCDGSAFAKGEVFTPFTREQGQAPVLASQGAGLGNVSQDCAPAAPACPDVVGQRQSTFNSYGSVDWEWTGTAWKAIGFSAKRFNQRGIVNNDLLDDTHLSGAVPTPTTGATLGNSWQTIAEVCNNIVNDDCVPWKVRFDVRAIFSGSIAGDNYWNGRIIGTQTLTQGGFNGTAQHRQDERCRGADGCARLFDKQFANQAPNDYTVLPGENLEACVAMQLRIHAHEPSNLNEFGANAFALVAEITRDCG